MGEYRMTEEGFRWYGRHAYDSWAGDVFHVSRVNGAVTVCWRDRTGAPHTRRVTITARGAITLRDVRAMLSGGLVINCNTRQKRLAFGQYLAGKGADNGKGQEAAQERHART